jgi:hypothetical protein
MFWSHTISHSTVNCGLVFCKVKNKVIVRQLAKIEFPNSRLDRYPKIEFQLLLNA